MRVHRLAMLRPRLGRVWELVANLRNWSTRYNGTCKLIGGIQIQWNNVSGSLLDSYRVAHNLSTPAAFTSPLNQALLTNPGIGRLSPTMARKRDKRRVSKEQLALAVRKNFNGAAVNEIDVVVELVYKVRNQGTYRCLQTML